MNNFTPLIIIIFLLVNLISANCFSQTIEWVYEVKAKEKTVPQFFWVDENGNGYYNIRQQNPNNPGDANYGSFLLMLDSDGQYKRTTKINDCEKSIKLLPFGKNKLISSGHNNSKDYSIKDTRLFNYKGNTLKISEGAFPGNYFASIPTESGFTFFSKPTKGWSYTYISIGKVNNKLNTTYDSISLKELTKKNLSITNSFRDPALTPNGTWVVPMQYGKIDKEDNSISLDHGIVLGIKESKILWQYPQNLLNRSIESISVFEDKIGVLMSSNGGYNLLVLLDQIGKELDKFKIRCKNSIIRDLILTEKQIIILGINNISWFDRAGNLIAELDLKKQGFMNANRMQLLNDGSIIFSARRSENAAIIKINLGNRKLKEPEPEKEIEKELVDDNDNEADAKISYGSIDNQIDNTIISATVYPNPTSSFINFEFDTEIEDTRSFLIQVFNSSGQLIITESLNQNGQPINVQSLPAGTYAYRITTNEKRKLITGQFIKMDR